MTSPRFLVLVPTHDHAELLPFSLRSALAQTLEDLELVVVGDGVGDDTRDVVAEFRRQDDRVRFVDRPKSPRTGEAYRHEVLRSTGAEYVTYLCDDDLLLPWHLEAVDAALQEVDLVHGIGMRVSPTGGFDLEWSDLAVPAQRERELGGTSLVGLSGTAHSMAAYRRLPHGWRSTPSGRFTDHYMYEQFLSDPACSVSALRTLTVLRFPDSVRRGMTVGERRTELSAWAERIGTPGGCADVVEEALAALYSSGVAHVELARSADAATVGLSELAATLRSEVDEVRSELAAVRAELAAAGQARREIEATATWRARRRLLRLLRRSSD